MKITISQCVALKGEIRTTRIVYKEFESNVIPHKGDRIYDSVWKEEDGYEVTEVAIDYTDNKCYVALPIIEIESEDENLIFEYIKMAKSHNWKCNTI